MQEKNEAEGRLVRLKRAGIITKIVIVALMVYAIATTISVRSRTAAALEQKATLEKQVTQMAQENAELQYGIDHSGDEGTIEDIAREKLGLVKPGEIIFYDVGD